MERSAEVEAVVRDVFQALGKGDVAGVQASMDAGGVRVVGSDEAEWWGPDSAEVKRLIGAQVQEMGGQMSFDPAELEGYREGTIGWAAARPRVNLPDGTSFATRYTAVLRYDESAWRFVQFHLSIGQANEDTFGQEFTTS